jgi:hypothetical protein
MSTAPAALSVIGAEMVKLLAVSVTKMLTVCSPVFAVSEPVPVMPSPTGPPPVARIPRVLRKLLPVSVIRCPPLNFSDWIVVSAATLTLLETETLSPTAHVLGVVEV